MRYKKLKPIRLTGQDIPGRLLSIPNAPEALFVAGDLACLQNKCVAIVGSRKVTPYGREVTEQFASTLVKQGVTIISGLALGVDAIAHQACLKAGGKTIAVLPTSLDAIYPATHQNLAQRILEQGGALISEYENQSQVFKPNFVMRNRLISGLADAVLITEAAEKSGSLHTANFAKKQNKQIFAIPGPINSQTSKGTNQLLQQEATIALKPEDIMKNFGIRTSTKRQSQIAFASKEQAQLYKLIKSGVTNTHELQKQSQLPVDVCNKHLTLLELADAIRADSNNNWGINQ
jgi:DNA processing protein